MRPKTTLGLAAFAATALAVASSAPAALLFNNTITGGTAQFNQAVTQAEALWSAELTDGITVNLNFTFANFGGLAVTNSARAIAAYGSTPGFGGPQNLRNALAADATSPNDAVAVANLPTGDTFNFLTRRDNATFFDNNGTNNNRFLSVNRANLKALGLIGANDAASDATIRVALDPIGGDPRFTYDYDRSDGIGDNQFDVVGIIAHEIGHALGFTSFTDSLAGGFNDNDDFAELNTLDFFRRKSPGGSIDVTPGGSPFLSVNGSNTIGPLSSGVNSSLGGDGNQASHWQDRGFGGNPGPIIGIMDPIIANGELQFIRDADRTAFDLIGYNLTNVPEPTTLMLAGLGGLALLRRRRA